MLGEMVQYKNYHAEQTPPYPIDPEVAQWVLWARKHGVLPRLPIDGRELLRPERVKVDEPASQDAAEIIIQVKGSGAASDRSRTRPESASLTETPTVRQATARGLTVEA